MKRITLLLIAVSLLSINSFAQMRRATRRLAPQTAATRPNTQTLPIRRVILYSNGVAYIERRGSARSRARPHRRRQLQLQRATRRAHGRYSLFNSRGN